MRRKALFKALGKPFNSGKFGKMLEAFGNLEMGRQVSPKKLNSVLKTIKNALRTELAGR